MIHNINRINTKLSHSQDRTNNAVKEIDRFNDTILTSTTDNLTNNSLYNNNFTNGQNESDITNSIGNSISKLEEVNVTSPVNPNHDNSTFAIESYNKTTHNHGSFKPFVIIKSNYDSSPNLKPKIKREEMLDDLFENFDEQGNILTVEKSDGGIYENLKRFENHIPLRKDSEERKRKRISLRDQKMKLV